MQYVSRIFNLYFTGFGENLDGNGSWKACVKYVDDQFMAYFDGESGLNRKNIIDTRVHCCLYFIPPYGHGWVSCTPILVYLPVSLNLNLVSLLINS